FLFHLHRVAISVTWVGEVDAALRIDGEVIRRIEFVSFVLIGQNGDAPIGLGPRDAPVAPFADQQPSLRIEEQPAGPAFGAEDLRGAGRVAAEESGAPGEIEIAFPIPRGTFSSRDVAEIFRLGAWRDR